MGVNPQHGDNGFTLLEILVAVALIGLLFVGIGIILDRQLKTQFRLEERLAASQVGGNLMELFQAEGMPVTPDLLSGEENLAGRTWPWTRQILAVDEGRGHEAIIRVGPPAANPLFETRLRWPIRQTP